MAHLAEELLTGRDAEEMRALAERFARMMRGEALSEAERASLGEATALAGVALFPTRVKCALLAWSTLDEALEG
jgi:nitrogen fixation NifU-like protein